MDALPSRAGRHARARRRASALPLWCLAWCAAAVVAPPLARGQERRTLASDAFWWTAGAVVGGAALGDRAFQRYSAEHRSPGLDRLASAGDALGTGRNLIIGMGATYLGARLFRRRELAAAVVHAAVAYAAGNVVVSALKPAVGRHRPVDTDDPWRFRPFSTDGVWHSFPSAHTVHAFTLAAAVAEEGGSRPLAAAGYGAAAVVAWSRVYDSQHWASDVAATGVLGIVTTRATLRWLHRRAPHEATDVASRPARLRPLLLPDAVGVEAAW
jgi:membrane-associated phospholipid phosphatase